MKQESLNNGEAFDDGVRAYLADIGKVALLSADDEVELSKKIEAGLYAEQILAGNQEYPFGELNDNLHAELVGVAEDGGLAFDQFLAANTRLVVSLAKKYKYLNIDLLDMIQEGNLGLVRAVQKFDHKKGIKFSTYATWWIKQSLYRGVAYQERAIRLPVHQEEAVRTVGAIIRRLNEELGRMPTDQEVLAAKDNLNAEDIALYNLAKTQVPVSLNTKLADGDGSELGEVFGADRSQPLTEEVVEEKLKYEALWSLLGMLDSRSAEIIIHKFGLGGEDPKTRKAIGEMYGITGEAVRQAEVKAMGKLKEYGASLGSLDSDVA